MPGSPEDGPRWGNPRRGYLSGSRPEEHLPEAGQAGEYWGVYRSRTWPELGRETAMPAAHERSREPAGNSRLISSSPVFYGWIIMAVATLGMVMASPGMTYVLSVFTDHLIVDLGLSRSVVSSLYSAGTLVGGLLLPFVGRLVDRRGPRMMVGVISTVFGVSCVCMGFVRGALMLGLGFAVLRMLGPGGMILVSNNLINQWWVGRRGMVMGISGSVVSLLSVGAFPILVNRLIPAIGWRFTFVLMGLVLLFVMLPLGVVFFRDRPEDYGLAPDGRQPRAGSEQEPDCTPSERDWETQAALRSRAFWVPALSLGVAGMIITALFFHMLAILQDNQIPGAIATAVFGHVALATALVRLCSGVLVDRFPPRVLLAVALLLQSAVLVAVPFVRGTASAVVYGIALGTILGLMETVSGVIWAAYFGRRHLGSIAGLASTLLIVGCALGPMPFGIARDVMGNFTSALKMTSVLPLLLAAVVVSVGRPLRASEAPAR